MKFVFALMTLILSSGMASAMSLDWTGVYRFEWTQVDNPSLDTPSRKAYGLNYLGLNPRIIASDGVNIHGKFDVLPSTDGAYGDAQIGQIWGLNTPVTGGTRVGTRATTGTNILTRELYLHVSQEHGSLLVGRAPFDFGLGLVWNAGNGPFDHWATNSDLVAYKFYVGNFSFMPMIARVSAPSPEQIDVIQDQTFQFQYEAEESGSMIGAIISRRQSSPTSNDAPLNIGGGAGTRSGSYSMETKGFVLAKKWDSFRFKMEGAFVSGDYGVSVGGTNVENASYGLALELDFPRPDSRWDFGLKLGMASGDDPSTTDKVEGFSFHRNYDVAMLLFNHRLGQVDLLQTDSMKDTTKTVSTSLDDEAISNVMFVSPRIEYRWNDRWELTNRFTYAQLLANPNAAGPGATDFKKDLGFEWDIGLTYKPRSNIRWVNEVGLLFPGGAFKNGASDLKNGFTFGFASKLAITF